jgi:uncharacterized membrane protein
LGDRQQEDMDAIRSDLGEVKGRLERITAENRRTSLFFTALGAGLSLLLVGVVLLAVGGDSVITLESSDVTMYVPSFLVAYGKIFTIIGLVMVFSSVALAWLWPRLSKQD